MAKKASGILLHISSLPSKYGIGDLGPQAYRFVDFLKSAKQQYWQVLPINDTIAERGFSPYDCSSAFAGNRLLISPQILYSDGLLDKKTLEVIPVFRDGKINYQKVNIYKTRLLSEVFDHSQEVRKTDDYKKFCFENSYWLETFSQFMAIKKHAKSKSWQKWPKELRDRQKQAIKVIENKFSEDIEYEKFVQYLFFKQWFSLKNYCRKNDINIIGDIPIYVAYESSDVWTHPEMFKLTMDKKPWFVAGVPPDFFSESGQLWNNPIYNWNALKKSGYKWWLQRIGHNMSLFDMVRLDHFRGFVAFWQVPASCKTAKPGRWIKGPGKIFMQKVFSYFSPNEFIAEDLGYITRDVRKLIKEFNLPCMRVLLFSFDGDPATNVHCLHNHIAQSVIYTGTHDNNTIRGWFEKEATENQKQRLYDCIGNQVKAAKIPLELIRMAMSSAAKLAIIPMQDVLGLDASARMNTPGTTRGNWQWQLSRGQNLTKMAKFLTKFAKTYGRTKR